MLICCFLSSLVKCLFQISAHFCVGACFSCYWSLRVLYILWMWVLYQIHVYRDLYLPVCVFGKAKVFNFNEVCCINFTLGNLVSHWRRICLAHGHGDAPDVHSVVQVPHIPADFVFSSVSYSEECWRLWRCFAVVSFLLKFWQLFLHIFWNTALGPYRLSVVMSSWWINLFIIRW